MRCFRCQTKTSVFWWRISIGCDSEGNNGNPKDLCDDCWYSFIKWKLEGKE